MKKKTCKVIICICLFVLVFTNFSRCYAAINEDYLPQKEVSENALDSKIKAPVLLDALANMINALASLTEYLIGTMFSDLTGDNVFPWADRIIFNGIAFLDINFLNPAENSLFKSQGSDTVLGKAVISVYSTVFYLAVLFLGVAVGIMAIRLAISSIASEKAKYKQAIVNWATCIVMLFMMHYILSFVFWINEKMVTIASGILTNTIQDTGITEVNFEDALNGVLSPGERINKYLSIIKGGWFNDVSGAETTLKNDVSLTNDFLTSEDYYTNRMVYIASNNDKWYDKIGNFFGAESENNKVGLARLKSDIEDAKSIKDNLDKAKSDMKNNGFYQGPNSKIWTDVTKYKNSQDYEDDVREYALCLALAERLGADKLFNRLKDYPERKILVANSPNFWTSTQNVSMRFAIGSVASTLLGPGGFLAALAIDNTVNSPEAIEAELNNKSISDIEKNIGGGAKVITYRMKCDKYIWNAANGGNAKGSAKDMIASLAYFFKRSAFVYDTTDDGEVTGWRASKISVVGALLYGIFIVQSLLYLFTYVRRLFYVIMLAMFGPIVVIYDFFAKTVSG